MIARRARLTLFAVVLCAAGGASSGVTACASASARGSAAPSNATFITRAEVLELRFANAYDAVLSLHPNWMVVKGAGSFRLVGQVQVYLDESHLGGVETLKSIGPLSISSIHHVRALEATARWGINHDQGAIVVATHP